MSLTYGHKLVYDELKPDYCLEYFGEVVEKTLKK
jgi:hypothetical protein